VERLIHNLDDDVRRIESQYLLTALATLGKEYLLPQQILAKYFSLEQNDSSGNYVRAMPLNHFEITTLMGYIGDREKYSTLRGFLESHLLERLNKDAYLESNGAERLIMMLDFVTCPYISQATREAIGKQFDLTPAELTTIRSSNDQWFTAWGKNFKPGKELDAKRSREVY
jgi:hypothetical protein